ncbi:MAG: DUF481 domain-containing protein, partial [Planctomycetota bacterium]
MSTTGSSSTTVSGSRARSRSCRTTASPSRATSWTSSASTGTTCMPSTRASKTRSCSRTRPRRRDAFASRATRSWSSPTKDDLRAIIPGRQTEWNYWSGKLSFGATVRRGNVDQTDISASFRVQRRDPGSRLNIDYNGAYSTVDSEKTADNHRGVINYDLFLTRRLYFRPVWLIAYRDTFQNIDIRLTPAIGAGYELLDRDGITWEVGGGVGWEFVRFADPLPDGEESEDSAAVLLSSSLEWEATPK